MSWHHTWVENKVRSTHIIFKFLNLFVLAFHHFLFNMSNAHGLFDNGRIAWSNCISDWVKEQALRNKNASL
jgi:hypothetical protein